MLSARVVTRERLYALAALREVLPREGAGVAIESDGENADAFVTAMREAGGWVAVDRNRILACASEPAFAAVRERLASDACAVAASDAIAADRARLRSVRLRDRTLDLGERARVMAILNVTPDSFYDGGRYAGIDRLRERAAELVRAGADVIDIGGQSYASTNVRVAADEEAQRVVPVVRALVRDGLDVALSIDTVRASVAERALDAGAHLINDCSGLGDPAMAAVVARADAGLVVMHLRGRLNVREATYRYEDALGEIVALLRERCAAAIADGVDPGALVVDPGLEFGKETPTDLEILANFAELRSLGLPILFAASRKSFIGTLFARPAKELLVPSLATAAVGILAGARIVRVHDVAETLDLARMLAFIETAAAERTEPQPAVSGL